MRIRLKRAAGFGVDRIDKECKMEKVEIIKSTTNPDRTDIVGYFRGDSSSGIINFSAEEIKLLSKKIKEKKKKSKKKKY